MTKLLIIPDVHSRVFWKEATEKYDQECDKIIFLGDYVDTFRDVNSKAYNYISPKEQLENLKNDVKASCHFEIDGNLHEDDAFITNKLEDFVNV